nr:hypothetical protein OG999_06310 [Streptomyces sp. NBC_00886]
MVGPTTLTMGFALHSADVTDLLERPSADAEEVTREDDRLTLWLRPFEPVTLRLGRS